MKVWHFDTRPIDFTKETSFHLDDSIVKSFFDTNDVFFLIGEKGHGKTYFLSQKSNNLRNNNSHIYLPKNKLYESISIPFHTLEYADLLKFQKLDWEKTWFNILLIYIQKEVNSNIFLKDFKDSNSLSSIISIYIQNWKVSFKNENEFKKALGAVASIRNNVYIFIDDLHDSLLYALSYWLEVDKKLCSDIISNFISGFCNSIVKLNKVNKKIIIYSTVQKNIFDIINSLQKKKITSYSAILQYKKDDLINIFYKNLQDTPKEQLLYPDDPDELVQFFGFNKIEYKFYDNNLIYESPIDYLIRHTRATPREIKFLGHSVLTSLVHSSNYIKLTKDEKIELFKSFTANFSRVFIDDFFRDSTNSVSEIEVAAFVNTLSSFVITFDEVFSNLELVKSLYNLGLVGIVEKLGDNLVQSFSKFSDSFQSDNYLPFSKYYLLHPLLHRYLNNKRENIYPIIGSNHFFMENKYRFDVAFSFAGEDRSVVENIVKELDKRKLSFFYDNHYKEELWGKDLYQYLSDIYTKKAKYCIIFISRNYANKLWTKHELRNAQARAFKDSSEYILPIRLDDTEILGLNETIGYLKFPETSEKEIADLILKKLSLIT